MKTSSIVVTLILGTVLQSAAPAFAQVESTSPGKTSVYSSGNVTFAGSIADITGTIAKGKKGRVVEAEANGEMLGCTGDAGFAVTVNGFPMLFGTVYVDSSESSNRTGSGVFWLDLDAAEAFAPGTFINQPLNIVLRANSGNCPDGATFSGTLRARIAKK